MLELKAGSSVPCCRFLLSLHGKTLEVLSVPPSVCLSQEGRHVHHLHPAKYWASMSFEPGGHLIVSPDAQRDTVPVQDGSGGQGMEAGL